MRKLWLTLGSVLTVAVATAAYVGWNRAGFFSVENAAEDDGGPPNGDDWIARYTYPTGRFDPAWALEAAVQDRAMAAAIPAGPKTYVKSRVPNSPLTLDPGQFVALGPMPENNTQNSYGSVSGRVNVIVVDPVDPTIAYAGSDGGGVWKTTNCCSLAAPPNPTSWSVVTNMPEIAGLSISDITIDPHDHNTIYASTGDLNYGSFSFGASGVLKSTDQGQTWALLGTAVFSPYYTGSANGFPQYQAIGKVAVDPNNADTIMVGTKTSIYFSYDAGTNWVGPCYTNAFATSATPQRQDVTGLIPVSNGDGTTRLYAALGTRGAATPVQPDLGQTGSNGVYRLGTIPASGCPATNDWTLLANGWPVGTGNGVAGATDLGRIELAVAPSQPNTVYAMAASAASRNVLGVWRSDDAGDTWVKRAATANVVGCESSSSNGGSQMWYDAGLTVHPTDPETTYLSGFDVYRSTNGGTSFADITCGWGSQPAGTLNHVHVDQHARAFLPGNPEKMLIGSDGGVFYTENASATFPSFRQLNNTINSIEFYFGDITSNFANSATPAVGAGAQDNGCSAVKFTGTPTGALQWNSNCSGDGTMNKIEPIGNSIWFNSSQYGSLARSLTYGSPNPLGGSFSTASGNTGGTWGGTADLSSSIFAMSYDIYKWGVLDQAGSGCSTASGCNHMIAGTNRLWETVDMTNPTTATMRASWKARTPNLTKNNLIIGTDNRSYINYVAYSFTDPTVAAVGTNDGNMQLVFGLGTAAAANCPAAPPLDGNCATPVNVTNGNTVLPNRPIFGVRFDPRTALVAYAAVGGFDQNTPAQPGHVFQVTCSAYNCPSFMWKDKSGNLPNVPVEQIMPNPNRPDQVFAGTDWGLYYTDDISVDTPNWQYFAQFPRVMVWELVVDRGFTTLAAFTRSRGAWVWPLPAALVGSGADLEITKTGSASVLAGTQATFVINVTNHGPNTATNVVVTDPVPAGVTLASVTGDCAALPCTFPSLASGVSRTITATYAVPATASSGQNIVNVASVSSETPDDTPANNSATATTVITTSADLALSMSGPASVTAGNTVSYSITLTNNGPSTAQAISVADATPPGLTFVSNTGCVGGTFPCTIASLASGAQQIVTATFAVPAGYTTPNPIVNSASVSATTSDPNAVNNTASANVSVTPTADLAVVLVAPSGIVLPGARFTYTVSVTNNGPNDAANVQLASTLPAGLGFVGNAGDCASAWPCSFASVISGQTRMVTTTVCVPKVYLGANPFALNASASASTTDPLTANNTAAANLSVASDVLFRDGFDADGCP